MRNEDHGTMLTRTGPGQMGTVELVVEWRVAVRRQAWRRGGCLDTQGALRGGQQSKGWELELRPHRDCPGGKEGLPSWMGGVLEAGQVG